MITAKGYNGTVRFDNGMVTLDRTGFAARVLIGSGSKAIPVDRITAVQLVPAKLGFRGFIQFTIGGGIERRATFGHRTTDAAKDENSVMFNRHQQFEFVAMKMAIEAAMQTGTPEAITPDIADRLVRLAELLTSGALTADEFTAAKGRVLSGAS